MSAPIEGLKVVSLGTSVSGPLCARLLGDLGAEVVKVERPGTGDFSRDWDEVLPGMSSAHLWCNPNKRSITLNMKSPAGREVLGRLLLRTDVFIENFSPGTVEDLGIDYPWARALNGRLIYCRISGYGQDGPYRDMKALDMLIQGESGLIDLTGSPEAPAKVALSIADAAAALYAVIAIEAALEERHRSGQGQLIDVSMFDCLVSLLGYFPFRYWADGKIPERVGLRHHLIAPYGPFRARDGRLVNLSAATPEAWRKLCQVLGRPHLAEAPEFSTNARRLRNREALDRAIEEAMGEEDSGTWIERFREAGIPFGAVNNLAEVLSHPQTLSRGLIQEVDSPQGRLRLLAFPVKFSRSETHLRPPPALGEHTEAVLAELGYTREEREGLRRGGAL